MIAGREGSSPRRFLVAAIAYAALLFGISQVPGAQLARLGFDIWDKAAHAVAYAPLGALVMAWLSARRPDAAGVARALLVVASVAITVGYGLVDELHQAFVPGRDPSLLDATADLVGGAAGAIAASLWRGSSCARPIFRKTK